jgi:hypothetical protein
MSHLLALALAIMHASRVGALQQRRAPPLPHWSYPAL